MLMQLIVELGPVMEGPRGRLLQESMKAKIREIVLSQKDKDITDHYKALAEFTIEQATQLGLYHKRSN